MNSPNQPTFRLADIEIDLVRGCLRRNGEENYLREQALQVFCYLIKHPAETVTKQELIDNVWQGTAVTDDAIVQSIVEIRKALGDDSRHPRFIKTVPKVGYRFIAPIEDLRSSQISHSKVEEAALFDEGVGEGIVKTKTETYDETATKRLLPGLPKPRRLRAALITTIVLILVTTAALAFYFRKSLWQSNQQLSETTLPQVPGRLPIAIMFFENRTDHSELDWLREGIADMLITDLSRSPKLTVLNRQQLHLMLDRIGYKQGEEIRLDQALEIARRSRAEAIILGSFARLGEQVRIDVQLYNVHGGQLLAAEGVNIESLDRILTDIDLLALKLSDHLGVAPGDQQNNVGLVDVMTNNLEAYRYYSLALEKAAALHNKEAIELLKRAVAIDPQFAMAHARIGYAHAVTGNFADEAKPYLEKAFQLSHRLTDKDKLHIRAWYAIANLDYPEAIKTFREIIARYPLDVEAYWRTGRLLDGEEQLEEAVAILKQGLAVDSEAKDIYNALGGIYSALGRHDDAIATCQRYLELAPGEPNAHDSLGLAYQWAGDYERALEQYNRALALDAGFERSIVHVGNIYFQLGRYREAIQQYRKYNATVSSKLEIARGFGRIAWVNWKKRDLRQAEEAARQEMRYEETAVWNSLVLALERNDQSTVEKLKQRLNAFHFTSRGARTSRRYMAYFLGYIALKDGNTSEALEKFKEAVTHRPPIWATDSYEDCLANAYLELGRLDEAIAEYERILRLNPNYPLVHYHLAEAYAKKNQNDRARSEYQKFLQIWKDADSDIPEVQAAKRQLQTQ